MKKLLAVFTILLMLVSTSIIVSPVKAVSSANVQFKQPTYAYKGSTRQIEVKVSNTGTETINNLWLGLDLVHRETGDNEEDKVVTSSSWVTIYSFGVYGPVDKITVKVMAKIDRGLFNWGEGQGTLRAFWTPWNGVEVAKGQDLVVGQDENSYSVKQLLTDEPLGTNGILDIKAFVTPFNLVGVSLETDWAVISSERRVEATKTPIKPSGADDYGGIDFGSQQGLALALGAARTFTAPYTFSTSRAYDYAYDFGTYYWDIAAWKDGYPGQGGETVLVRAQKPFTIPYTFDMTVSIEWDIVPTDTGEMGPSFANTLVAGLRKASEYLFDATDGQMCFGKITIYDNGENWDDCDLRIHEETETDDPLAILDAAWPKTSPSLEWAWPPLINRIEMGRKWVHEGDHIFDSWDDPLAYSILIHEFGHLKLGLLDEYMHDPLSYSLGDIADMIVNNDLGTAECTASLMDDQWAEFCNPANHDPDKDTWHEIIHGKSCWSTIKEKFPWIYIPMQVRGGPYDRVGNDISFDLGGRSGGPDYFGYTYLDSNSLIGPVYDWIEISETGTMVLPSSDDAWVGNINIGFFFNYYGTDYSQLAIGNNGLLFSGVGTSQYVNQPITQTPSIHGLIAPFWDDIVTWGSAGAIYYQTLGTAPNRKFVVEWYDNQHYYSSTSGITFEAILYEGTNNILFQYKDVDFGSVSGSTSGDRPPYNNGGSATVGIEDPTGNIGLQYSFNEQVITLGLAILFKFPAFAGTNMYLSMNAPARMDRGSSMTCTLYYNDFGDIAASNVILQATLSPNVDFASASDGGAYDPATRRVTWNIGTVPAFPSGRGSRTITVTIPASVPIGTVIQTTASISTSTLETRYDDNTASAQTTVTGSNLPPNVGVGPTLGTTGGIPSVYWRTPITFTYYAPTATGVDIRIHFDGGGSDITGSMTGGPPAWTYTTTFYPRTGRVTVTYTIAFASPNGLHLPVPSGLIGLEQHLYNNYPGDGYVPPSGTFPASGLLGIPAGYSTYTLDNGYAGLGAFAPHPSDLSEKYYINMRWPDGVDWSPTQYNQPPIVTDPTTYANYAHKKVLITAPSTGKALVASIEEAGPALWTGKDAGAPPEVFVALGLYPRGDTQNEASIYTLNFEWADQNAPLGPCVPDVTFSIYIDPAGYVHDVNTGERISGAAVWLQRPDGQGGWENVPTGQIPPIMQPDVNPQITGADGQYQWDVLEGSYRVHVEASGYYPADSIVVNIPPPVTDLHVGLTPLPPPPDPVPPTTAPTIGDPKYTDPSGNVFVTSDTPFTLSAEDNVDGSGVATTGYRIRNATYDSGWTASTPPIEFYLTGLADGLYFIDYNSTDNVGNIEPTQTISITLDNSGPLIIIENPPAGWALQDGVTFIALSTDPSGTYSLNFSIREANGDQGIPVGFENIPATYNATTGRWNWSFNTLRLPDGFYIVLVNAEDNLGHTASITVPYSIRNWAVLELLPATPNNKAGRTMPVKFALRVAASVDPTQPFVYNEELTIKICATDNPSNILQTSTFGGTARDYRINTLSEQYITNFQTLKTPKTYMVEIWRKNMLIGSFQFKTVK